MSDQIVSENTNIFRAIWENITAHVLCLIVRLKAHTLFVERIGVVSDTIGMLIY